MPTNYDKISTLIDRLRILDSGLFQMMFHDDIPLVEFVFRTILDEPDLVCVDAKVEYRVINSLKEHDGVFDLHAAMKENKIDILEMQRNGRLVILFPRMEFYAALTFIAALNKGASYEQIPDVTVIFFTETDVFGMNLPKYTLGRSILETGEVVDTHLKIVCVNGAYEKTDTALGKLIHDFRQCNPNQLFHDNLRDKMRQVKYGKERKSMMTFTDSVWEEVRAEMRVELRDEVKREVKNEIRDEMKSEIRDEVKSEVKNEIRDEVKSEVKNEIRDEISQAVKIQLAQKMLARNLPIAEIAEDTELSIEQVRALQQNL
ncbi:hypothetical protein [uncultured Dubosiella sp.]|uniref:hypothetical protein n=4 Tax=uncultured Dubosiella sp. TaxID=1937011 RepID=UPI002588A9C0|nr:hypothetical protein [uncultured Dubosiella sp.]